MIGLSRWVAGVGPVLVAISLALQVTLVVGLAWVLERRAGALMMTLGPGGLASDGPLILVLGWVSLTPPSARPKVSRSTWKRGTKPPPLSWFPAR